MNVFDLKIKNYFNDLLKVKKNFIKMGLSLHCFRDLLRVVKPGYNPVLQIG